MKPESHPLMQNGPETSTGTSGPHVIYPTLHHSHVGWHTPLTDRIEAMVRRSLAVHMPEDHIDYNVSIYPMPTDTTWEPAFFLFLLLQPVGDTSVGAHYGQFSSPYVVTPELIDGYVKDFADTTTERRTLIRKLRSEGATSQPGLAVEPDVS